MKGRFFLLFLFLFVLFKTNAQVESPDPGFSGFFQLSAGPIIFKANNVATLLRARVTNSVIPSLDEAPTSQTTYTLMNAMEFKYTFRDRKNQIFFGSSIQDIIRLDLVQQLAYRRFIKNGGFVSVGFLLSTFPIRVWEDPFVTGQERTSTIRQSPGIRVEWSRIGKSNLGIQYDARFISIDEKSGEFLGLPEEQKKMLNRNGISHRLAFNYQYRLGEKQFLVPVIRLTFDERKGDARSGFIGNVDITHTYRGGKWVFISTALAIYGEHYSRNPVFDQTQRNLGLGVRETVYYQLSEKNRTQIQLVASLSGMNFDSNINFYRASALFISAGAMLRFLPKKAD